MVSKCANPSCDTVFRYFRGGKIFLVEPAPVIRIPVLVSSQAELHLRRTRSEHFWLCEQCCKNMTITFDPDGRALVACHKQAELEPATFHS